MLRDHSEVTVQCCVTGIQRTLCPTIGRPGAGTDSAPCSRRRREVKPRADTNLNPSVRVTRDSEERGPVAPPLCRHVPVAAKRYVCRLEAGSVSILTIQVVEARMVARIREEPERSTPPSTAVTRRGPWGVAQPKNDSEFGSVDNAMATCFRAISGSPKSGRE